MTLSDRNPLQGTIEGIQTGGATAHVTIRTGDDMPILGGFVEPDCGTFDVSSSPVLGPAFTQPPNRECQRAA
jgi:hypothetical protein